MRGDTVENHGITFEFALCETVAKNALCDAVILVGLEEKYGLRGRELRMEREAEQATFADDVRVVDFGEQFDAVGAESVDAIGSLREIKRSVGSEVGSPRNFEVGSDRLDRGILLCDSTVEFTDW